MKWLIGLFVVLLIAIVIMADRGQLPRFVVAIYSYPGGDKLGHFILMGILSFLVNLALMSRSTPRLSRRVLLGNLIILVVVGMEEVSQLLFKTRTFSFSDLASSYAGILCFAYLASLAARWRK